MVKVGPLIGVAVGVNLTSTFQFGPLEPEKTPAGKRTPFVRTVTPFGVSLVLIVKLVGKLAEPVRLKVTRVGPPKPEVSPVLSEMRTLAPFGAPGLMTLLI